MSDTSPNLAPPATEVDLDGIRESFENATSGEWLVGEPDDFGSCEIYLRSGYHIGEVTTEEDATFIAKVHADIPALLSLVERLQRDDGIYAERVMWQQQKIEKLEAELEEARLLWLRDVAKLTRERDAMRPVVEAARKSVPLLLPFEQGRHLRHAFELLDEARNELNEIRQLLVIRSDQSITEHIRYYMEKSSRV
jgi:hypothetical protein